MTEAERDEFKRLQAIRMVARGATPEEIAKTLGITIVQARILCTLRVPQSRL